MDAVPFGFEERNVHAARGALATVIALRTGMASASSALIAAALLPTASGDADLLLQAAMPGRQTQTKITKRVMLQPLHFLVSWQRLRPLLKSGFKECGSLRISAPLHDVLARSRSQAVTPPLRAAPL